RIGVRRLRRRAVRHQVRILRSAIAYLRPGLDRPGLGVLLTKLRIEVGRRREVVPDLRGRPRSLGYRKSSNVATETHRVGFGIRSELDLRSHIALEGVARSRGVAVHVQGRDLAVIAERQ